jgi:hypothetical protein
VCKTDFFKNHIKKMDKSNLKKNSCYNIHSIQWEDICLAKWGWYLPTNRTFDELSCTHLHMVDVI